MDVTTMATTSPKATTDVSFSGDWDSDYDAEIDIVTRDSMSTDIPDKKLQRTVSFESTVDDDLDMVKCDSESNASADTILGAPTLPLHHVDVLPKLVTTKDRNEPRFEPFRSVYIQRLIFLFDMLTFFCCCFFCAHKYDFTKIIITHASDNNTYLLIK